MVEVCDELELPQPESEPNVTIARARNRIARSRRRLRIPYNKSATAIPDVARTTLELRCSSPSVVGAVTVRTVETEVWLGPVVTLEGENAQEAPNGTPVHRNEMVALIPFCGVTTILIVPDCPGCRLNDVGVKEYCRASVVVSIV